MGLRSLFILILLSGCGPVPATTPAKIRPTTPEENKPQNQQVVSASFSPPVRKATASEVPHFIDDLDFAYLDTAIDRQLERFEQKNLSGLIKMGDKAYPLQSVPASLKRLKGISGEFRKCLGANPNPNRRSFCQEIVHSLILKEFDIFKPDVKSGEPRFNQPHQTFFTAYYTPLIEASLKPTATHRFPIYKLPDNASMKSLSRTEIDFKGKLAGKGLELFYAPDLYELYLLQVQGGGKIVVEVQGEKKSYYLSYDGANGKSFAMISLYMKQKGYIQDLSVPSQRTYLKAHPEKWEEIYASCPNYVFFKITSTPPEGSDQVPLTDNRSIATDFNYYAFKGLLAFVDTYRPTSVGDGSLQKFSRFMIDQDTGGSIKGKARVDLYFGEGSYAEAAAYSTNHYGDQYFLMLKNQKAQ